MPRQGGLKAGQNTMKQVKTTDSSVDGIESEFEWNDQRRLQCFIRRGCGRLGLLCRWKGDGGGRDTDRGRKNR